MRAVYIATGCRSFKGRTELEDKKRAGTLALAVWQRGKRIYCHHVRVAGHKRAVTRSAAGCQNERVWRDASSSPTTMRIEELVLDGFKSYPVRTVITGWDSSFNAITGLNGSGKSNILDAICFVLGITNMTSVRGNIPVNVDRALNAFNDSLST